MIDSSKKHNCEGGFLTLEFATSRLQDFMTNFLKNIFTSVLALQIAVASLGGPGMTGKENNCHQIEVK